jgi:hypothetical protein
MNPLITCRIASVYALTRGKRYELLAHDGEGAQVRVRADNGRCRWFPSECFDLEGGHIPILTKWRFDDPVLDELNGRDETNNWVDISLVFDDETRRWCQMVTPGFLKGLLEQRVTQPMIYARNLIVIRDLSVATVEQALTDLDQQGELFELSLPLDPIEEELSSR